jgi:hypothetical protein
MPGEPDPQHWRDLAREARARADHLKNPREKRRLLGLADFYERLAKQHREGSWSKRNVWKKSR